MTEEQNPQIVEHLRGLVDLVREPLALDRWQVNLTAGKMDDADTRAACHAMPEYREATIFYDLDELVTGDDLAEITVHEMAHCHTWPIHTLAEGLARALAESAPQSMRKGLRKLLLEEVRKAGEQVTTDVSQTYLRLLRRAGILTPPDCV